MVGPGVVMVGPGVIAPATASVGVGLTGGGGLVVVAEGVGRVGVVLPPFDGRVAEGVAVLESSGVVVGLAVAVDGTAAVVVVVAEGVDVLVVDAVGVSAVRVFVGVTVLVCVFVGVLPTVPWTSIVPLRTVTDASSTGSPPLSVPLRVTSASTAIVEPDAPACHVIVNRGQVPGPAHSLNRARARVSVPSEVDGEGIAISQPGSTLVESIVTTAGLYVIVTSNPSRVSVPASETLTCETAEPPGAAMLAFETEMEVPLDASV